jgi:cell division septal protein FtsQ
MARRSSSSSSRRKSSSKKAGATLFARLGIWSAVALAVIGVLYLGQRGIHHLFFSGNPHFVMRELEIEVAKGALSEERVRDLVGAVEGQDNLFSLDLGAVREQLLADPVVQEAEVRRRLPGVLHVRVYGRTPIAQLVRNGGPLIDGAGIVLPPSDRRDTLSLPVITGIPGLTGHTPGTPVDHPMLAAALELLRLRDTITNGHWYDVDFVQIDQGSQELRLLLRARPQLSIRDGCLVTVPVENMEHALRKGITVIEQRSKNHQPTGSLNLTYEKVPATP